MSLAGALMAPFTPASIALLFARPEPTRLDPGLLALGPVGVLLLIVLGIALVAVPFLVLARRPRRSSTAPPPPPDLGSLTIREARRGDLITIRGAGRDFEDLSFKVERIHRYEFGSNHWYELVGQSPEGPISLEWEDDGELILSLTPPGRTLRLPELELTEQDLIRMDEEQSAANTITHGETVYRYEESHETGYFEDEREPGEGFHMWCFEAEDGRSSLTIATWAGEAFEVMISDRVAPDDVTVYRP
jgi:hypothetical protein